LKKAEIGTSREIMFTSYEDNHLHISSTPQQTRNLDEFTHQHAVQGVSSFGPVYCDLNNRTARRDQ
jgi:hypothetical protein